MESPQTVQDFSPPAISNPHVARLVLQHRVQVDTFLHDHRLAPLWRGISRAADDCLRALVGEDAPYAVMAVGGYGRREMFPYSDIDMMIIVPDGAVCMVPDWLYAMWDSPFRIGHQIHTVSSACDAAFGEQTIATNFLDARAVAGDTRLAQRFIRRFRRARFSRSATPYIEAKLAERDARHTRYGDSRFILEPHIKDGKGGLRDLHTLEWIARYCAPVRSMRGCVAAGIISAESWKIFERNMQMLSRYRALMHALAGRANEQLTFNVQTALATALGVRGATPEQRAESLMQRYFAASRATGNITREFIAGLEDTGIRPVAHHRRLIQPIGEGMELRGGRLHIADAAALQHTPSVALKLFEQAHHHGHDLHPHTVRMLRDALPSLRTSLPQSDEANAILLRLLLGKKPASILRRMHDAGVLSAVLPEFAHIEGQMQYDGYHTYTVDEHTLVAIGNLHDFETGKYAQALPTTTEAAKEITERRALYVAMLCHDLAKGMGGGHAAKAVPLTHTLAARLGLEEAEAQLAGWLVENHLLLTDAAFKRDIEDPQTTAQLVADIQSPERLRLLLMLTVADVRAVGPKIWNNWKASLLREVYLRTLQAMGVKALRSMPEPAQHEAEALGMFHASSEAFALHIVAEPARAVTTLICVMHFRPEHVRLVTGVASFIGANIVSAKTSVEDDVLIMSLGLQTANGAAFNEADRLATFEGHLHDALAGTLLLEAQLDGYSRVDVAGKKRPIAPAMFIDNSVSTQASVIEVNAADRPGLLYDILSCFHGVALQVQSAHIATYGQKAVDVFYVKDKYGMKLAHPRKQRELIKQVLHMLESKSETTRTESTS